MLIRWLRWVLFPLAIVYDAITRVRNHLYDSGYKPSFRFDIPTVVVGNLNVGGSGKTPMIEYLVRLLKADNKIATLSRGYGRRTRGFKFASQQDDATTVGDEPLQLFKKFGTDIRVAVGEERALAIPTILLEQPETNLVLLDDAFQHRPVQGYFTILLTEYNRPFYSDWLLPTGNLRESGKSAKRADAIVVTKCPDALDGSERNRMTDKIVSYAGPRPVWFATIRYMAPVNFGAAGSLSKRVLVVSGIAHPTGLIERISLEHEIVKHFEFPDHHNYNEQELINICELASTSNCAVVTTEKDMVRLTRANFLPIVNKVSWFYLPIEMTFLENGSEFDTLVKEKLNRLLN